MRDRPWIDRGRFFVGLPLAAGKADGQKPNAFQFRGKGWSNQHIM